MAKLSGTPDVVSLRSSQAIKVPGVKANQTRVCVDTTYRAPLGRFVCSCACASVLNMTLDNGGFGS